MNMIELEKNIMKVDLTRAVKNYKKVNIYDCINEALVNSLQVNSNEINIKIASQSANELFNKEIISKITIQDTGDGFNENNRKSFLHLYSDYKEKDGCKGIGRLSYLKGFKNVKISSKQNNELVEFDFTKELNEEQLNPIKIAENTKQTTLTLENPINEETYNLDKIYEEIFNHIYPFIFLRNSECVININDRKITKDDVKNIENTKLYVKKTINNEEQSIEFNLWYRFQESDKTILDDFICINNRPMQHFHNKPLSLKLHSKEKYHITFLLESDWINQQSNQYHSLENEDEEQENNQLFNEINWQDVKQELIKKLNEIMIVKFPEMKNENKKIINDLKAKYPHYADFIENDNISFVNEKQLLKNAREEALKEEDKLENDNVSINDIQKCVSNDLIRYIKHRQGIIDKLQSLKNTKIESEVHNLFLEQGLQGTEERQVPLDKNNLWLLDDKFMSYSYIASEKAISTFLDKIGLEKNGSNEEMDIVLYSNSEEKKKVVILEMKKLTANYKENGTGINQLFNYSVQLYNAGIKELYLYLIAEIDDKFRIQLTSKEGFKKVFSQEGEIYQNSYNDFNAYIQIISPNAIIADANARNKTFLDIIKKSKTIQE